MTYTAFAIKPEQCVFAWKHVKNFLAEAIEGSKGRWQPEYVLAALVTGQQTLWVVTDENQNIFGACTTEIVNYPEKKMFAIHFLGGKDFGGWYEVMLDVLTKYAADAECDCVECLGRSGFWKWFEQDGWNKTSVFYEKNLRNLEG